MLYVATRKSILLGFFDHEHLRTSGEMGRGGLITLVLLRRKVLLEQWDDNREVTPAR